MAHGNFMMAAAIQIPKIIIRAWDLESPFGIFVGNQTATNLQEQKDWLHKCENLIDFKLVLVY